ncbi:hypothetical protein [Schleiferilactobacillus harbinensis]|uniref:Uncharacterized protein n=1 Tax=Schleiferilactobacillus harbinensis TaxID=304207 RepID=A0A5P8M6C5_9LACO|nr:hypothetical protein [Schleiferilactobacillus harbinensis]QFR23785.1 hypothetical protein D1010_10425 [Schleiferilactobacillus harbinensis]
MKSNKVQQLVLGIFFVVFGLYYVIMPAFEPFLAAHYQIGLGVSFLLMQFSTLVVVLMLMARLVIVRVVYGTFELRKHWFYWAPLLLLGVGLVVNLIWRGSTALSVGVPLMMLVLGSMMIICVLQARPHSSALVHYSALGR